ncbi:hypothetical protein ACS0TY_013809 [Phlomoides rotata]
MSQQGELIPSVNGSHYPVPLASHDDVVKDPTLFINTLRSFHFDMGTKFHVPVIGGKELDLHLLYVEVTSRGGYDKVVTDKKWREISSEFEFSPTTTSASYALRKHYFTLLQRYELVYYFRVQGSVFNPTGPTSFTVLGTIDAKFESGYLVRVKLGDQLLNGVLYHPAPATTSIVPYTPLTHQPGRRVRKRVNDPSRPKPNRSAYNFFFQAKHATLKTQYPNREKEFTKMIGEAWNKLSPEDKVVYQKQGLEDKERYKKEMEEYKRLRMEQSC